MTLYIIKCHSKLMGSTCYQANDKVEALHRASKLKQAGWKVEIECYDPKEGQKRPGQKGMQASQ